MKKKTKTKKKSTTISFPVHIKRKKLKKQLDDIFSLYIRERDNYTCITCGVTRETKVIQCGHLFSRTKNSTRWEEKNAHAQCEGCNKAHTIHWEKYRRKWIEIHGKEQYELLYAKYCQEKTFTVRDLEIVIQYYKNKLSILKGE